MKYLWYYLASLSPKTDEWVIKGSDLTAGFNISHHVKPCIEFHLTDPFLIGIYKFNTNNTSYDFGLCNKIMGFQRSVGTSGYDIARATTV